MKNILIILLLALSTSISATTYYIDPSGNNSNSGSASSPWNTLAYACSKVTASGDIIHVNAGTYSETNQCVLAAGVSIEGTGTASVIKSHYSASGLSSALILLSGGTNSGQHISGIYLDGDNLTGNNAIVVYNRSNVSIYNCTIINFLTQGVRFSGSSNSTGNSIYSCSITNCGGFDSDEHACLSLSYNTGILVYKNTIIQDKRSSGGTGLGIQGETNLYAAKIYDNYIRGTERSVSGNWTFAIEFWNSAKLCGYGLEIYKNTIVGEIDFGAGVTKGSYSYGVDFHDNIVGYEVSDIPSNISIGRIGLQFEEGISDVIVRSNVFKNVDRQIYFCSNGTSGSVSNAWIYSNIFQNVYYSYYSQTTATGYSAHGVGIIFGGSAFSSVKNVYIRNNDFIAYPGREAEIGVFLPTTGDCDEVYVQNNIFSGFATAALSAEAQSGGGTLTTLVIQKNVLYQNGNSNNLLSVSFTPANVTNDGGIKSNPLLVSSTDFHLQAGSPAIGNGLYIQGLTTDYEGKTFNNPPSIGAFESGSVASSPVIPVYVSSDIQNATPSLLEMTYNATLAKIVPAAAAFSVLVNSEVRTVNSVAVSGTKVQLALSSAIKFGDIVTVSYTKPSTNPLQLTSGGQATSISAKLVTNKLVTAVKDATPAKITMTITPNPIHKILNILFSYTSTFAINDASSSPQIIRIFSISGRLVSEKLMVTGATNIKFPINVRTGIYIVKLLSGGLEMASQNIIVN